MIRIVDTMIIQGQITQRVGKDEKLQGKYGYP